MSSPKIYLRFDCVERCGRHVEVELRGEGNTDLPKLESLGKQLNRQRWLLSLITPPGSGSGTLAVLCEDCVPKVYPPETVAEVKAMLARGEAGIKEFASDPTANPALVNPLKGSVAS